MMVVWFCPFQSNFSTLWRGLRIGVNLAPLWSGFGYRMSEFTAPVHMCSPLLGSVRWRCVRSACADWLIANVSQALHKMVNFCNECSTKNVFITHSCPGWYTLPKRVPTGLAPFSPHHKWLTSTTQCFLVWVLARWATLWPDRRQ